MHKSELKGSEFSDIQDEIESDGVFIYTIKIEISKKNNELVLNFE